MDKAFANFGNPDPDESEIAEAATKLVKEARSGTRWMRAICGEDSETPRPSGQGGVTLPRHGKCRERSTGKHVSTETASGSQAGEGRGKNLRLRLVAVLPLRASRG